MKMGNDIFQIYKNCQKHSGWVYDKLHFLLKRVSLGNQPNKIMKLTTATLKAEILSALSSEVDIWLEKQSTISDGYEYETQFMKVAQKVNTILLEKSMGKLPVSRNKKNFTPVLEKLKSAKNMR